MICSFLESLMNREHLLLLFVIIFILRFVIFSTLEYFFVAHDFDRKRVIMADLVSMFFYIVIIFPLAQYLSNYVGVALPTLSHINDIPLAVRILLYFIVADFLHYWLHLLMHQSFLDGPCFSEHTWTQMRLREK